MTQLSIIVPVYNVEKYIRPCFESIFRQGLDEDCYEVIIVNDGTKDRSMEMIADIINKHHNYDEKKSYLHCIPAGCFLHASTDGQKVYLRPYGGRKGPDGLFPA